MLLDRQDTGRSHSRPRARERERERERIPARDVDDGGAHQITVVERYLRCEAARRD